MKNAVKKVLIAFLVVTTLVACGDDTKALQDKLAKLRVVAEEINSFIDDEVKPVQAFLDSKPEVGAENASIAELQATIDDLEELKITVPADREYSGKELKALITVIEGDIKAVDDGLLGKLDLAKNDLNSLKEDLPGMLAANSQVKTKIGKVNSKKGDVEEAVTKEKERIAKEKKDKEFTLDLNVTFRATKKHKKYTEIITIVLRADGKVEVREDEIWNDNTGGYCTEKGKFSITGNKLKIHLTSSVDAQSGIRKKINKKWTFKITGNNTFSANGWNFTKK